MAKKQILTNNNIETDIKNILKRPANLSRIEHHKSMVPIWVNSVLVLIAMLVFQNYYKLVLLLDIIFIAIYLTVEYFRKKSRIKNVSIDDYEIKKVAASFVKEEVYSTAAGSYSYIKRKLKTVYVHIMYFENGKSWNIPKDNYLWSKECPMSDRTLHQITHSGDVFWVVTKKDTGEVVVAYPSEYFEYKN
jgi:hypothetical protein